MDVGDIKPFNWGQIFSYRKHIFDVGFYGGEEVRKKLFGNIIPPEKKEKKKKLKAFNFPLPLLL